MLSKDWSERKQKYDFVIVGSGYGGAILASRISGALKNPARTVCILERGKEWPVGSFPDTLPVVTAAVRNPLFNPLGLYEYLDFSDIAVIKGSGLGGTSLINANVAIIPDPEVLSQPAWPRSLNLDALRPYYEKAAPVLGARPHPRGLDLLKVQALERRARQIGKKAFGLNLTVNFDLDGENPYGVQQKPCIDCGDCVTGCNVGSKNTLYMNYLSLAKNNGAEIFTQTQVDWLEKLSGGGWRIHGRRFAFLGLPEKFTLDAGTVVLSGGALGTPEILLRSEVHGLSVSPRVGSAFTGNGDFFGLAYNSDYRTNVLGFGNDPDSKWRPNAPGPTIVGGIRYDPSLPFDKRITVEDLSFPKAYVSAVMVASGAMGGVDTDAGDEREELARRLRDNPLAPYREDNALNHTMVYLVMGHDDAKGTLFLRTDLLNPNGTLEIEWDGVGRQPVFTRINEELYRHARALGAHFIAAPLWNLMNLRKLVTAHPLGGCPVGEDYHQGAVDEFGRVFTGDGSIHQGLFVADGSLIPTSLAVNPFLTICALSERIAEYLTRNEKGEPYPARPVHAAVPEFSPLEAVNYREPELERVFTWAETKGMETMVNTGQRSFDMEKGLVRNDTVWKGFFPQGHILNQLSTAFYTGFRKKFTRTDKGIAGVTSDYDERINVRNTLEEIVIKERSGTLAPGRYVLLRYTDPPWSAFYDIFKVINDDLLIGRVYLGPFPNGKRLFTFPMTRVYSLANLTVDDHHTLYQVAPAPTKEQLAGLWEMRAVANARDTGVVAYLKFDLKPDGRLEARYRFLGLLEGMVEPVFAPDHFQMNDFTPFHDEIRFVDQDFLVGKYTTVSPPGLWKIFGPGSLGLFQQETGNGGTPQFSFYYTLRRSQSDQLPATVFLQPLLNIRLPDGLGMTFDEEMVGWYLPGLSVPPGRERDLQMEAKASPGRPDGGVECSFQVRMTIRDVNEFIEGSEHEARLEGTIHFADFAGKGPSTFPVDPQKSYFNYLRVNPATQEAEMVYHLYFCCVGEKGFLLEGRKYMQKDLRGGITGLREILHDYTTLYCHLTEAPSGKELGCGLLKFKTFEDLQAVGSMAKFFSSFQVTGTDNPVLKAEAQARFLAFTNQFILREYDPLNAEGSFLADEVREAVLRGAEIPDDFSTRPTAELQAVLRETPTLPLSTLLNRGDVRIDYEKKRIFRDSFWKGSFAKDSLLGWEEKIRNAALSGSASQAAERYTGGAFWKRFDEIRDGQAIGYVVNYELDFLPGKPLVKQVKYPDNNRKYFKAGEDVLLLTYTNEPYKIVYDVIKAIDENNCVGVMHLGNFPTGIESATFVMARHNYPFERMSVPDHQAIFAGDHVHIPTPSELAGNWEGHVIFLTRPDISLLNQVNPVLFRLRFIPTANGAEARFRFGLPSPKKEVEFTDESARLLDIAGLQSEIRMIDANTMLGRWVFSPQPAWLSPLLQKALYGFLGPGKDQFVLYYFLKKP